MMIITFVRMQFDVVQERKEIKTNIRPNVGDYFNWGDIRTRVSSVLWLADKECVQLIAYCE